MSVRLLFATLSLALCAGAAHAAPVTTTGELVSNGGFEATTVKSGNWITYTNAGGGYSGWTLGANGIEIRNDAIGAAYQGNNFAELDTTGNSWISQSLATTRDTLYTLTFAYSPRSNVGSDSNGIGVYWNGTLLENVTASGLVGDGAGNDWTLYTYNVVATGSSSVLKFAAAGKSDTMGGGIDAVSVKAAATAAVPEPASVALLGLGAAALAFSRRRKRG